MKLIQKNNPNCKRTQSIIIREVSSVESPLEICAVVLFDQKCGEEGSSMLFEFAIPSQRIACFHSLWVSPPLYEEGSVTFDDIEDLLA